MTLIQKCTNVITKPTACWEGIKAENLSVKGNIVPTALILAAIPAGFNFLGMLASGVAQLSFAAALLSTIIYYVSFALSPLLVGFVISALAPSFGGKKDLARACQLTYSAYIPAYIAGLFLFFTFTGMSALATIGSILSIYALVLLFLGAKQMLDVPQDKYVVLTIIGLVVAGVVFWLVGYIVYQLTWNMMWGSAAAFSAQSMDKALSDFASSLGGTLMNP